MPYGAIGHAFVVLCWIFRCIRVIHRRATIDLLIECSLQIIYLGISISLTSNLIKNKQQPKFESMFVIFQSSQNKQE